MKGNSRATYLDGNIPGPAISSATLLPCNNLTYPGYVGLGGIAVYTDQMLGTLLDVLRGVAILGSLDGGSHIDASRLVSSGSSWW